MTGLFAKRDVEINAAHVPNGKSEGTESYYRYFLETKPLCLRKGKNRHFKKIERAFCPQV